MDCFSEKTIKDIKLYWFKKWNKKISTEKAKQYLNTLAELYLTLAEIKKGKR